MTKPYFTVSEAAEMARCTETVIFQYAETNKLTLRRRTPERLWLELSPKAASILAEGADTAEWEEFGSYPTPTGKVMSHKCKVQKSDIYLWIEDVEVLKRLTDAACSYVPTNKIKELNYSTPALEIQEAAIREFWENHNPSRPPKSEVIIAWLMDNFNLSRNMAESIDQVIRSPNARKGGNKKASTSR